MFCDVVDSTTLSGQLDPEDYRGVLRAYQATCTAVIHRFDGYIAQHLGDALLVYFGFPVAHEDAAPRAIHAGLGMLAAMQMLNTRLGQEKGMRLSIRVGIHTGLIVIGDIGEGQKHELLALGEAPNVASRIRRRRARYDRHQCGDLPTHRGLFRGRRPGAPRPQRRATAHAGLSCPAGK